MTLEVRNMELWEQYQAAWNRFQAEPSEHNKRLMLNTFSIWQDAFLQEKK